MPSDDRYRQVYSTERGAICPKCSCPCVACRCASDKKLQVQGDGDVKVRREKNGRGGKTVTTISGLALNREQLAELLTALKRFVGGGGTEKNGILELQGDHCDVVISQLAKRGIKAKRAGG